MIVTKHVKERPSQLAVYKYKGREVSASSTAASSSIGWQLVCWLGIVLLPFYLGQPKWLCLVSLSHLYFSSSLALPLCCSAMPMPFLGATTTQSNAIAILALPVTTTEMLSLSPSSSLKARGQGSSLLTRGFLGGEILVFQMAQPCMYAKTHIFSFCLSLFWFSFSTGIFLICILCGALKCRLIWLEGTMMQGTM